MGCVLLHARIRLWQVFLSLKLALIRLSKAAGTKAQESKETVITPRHITAVASVSLEYTFEHVNDFTFIGFHFCSV